MKTIVCSLAMMVTVSAGLQAQNASTSNSFEAVAYFDDGRVVLEWDLSRETNTSFFQIERSSDSEDFVVVTTVPAAGYSYRPTAYQFELLAEDSSAAGYRITLVTMEGKRIESEEIVLPLSGDSILLSAHE